MVTQPTLAEDVKTSSGRTLRLQTKRALTAYSLLVVPLLFFVTIRIVPTIQALWMSLFTENGHSITLKNYQELFKDDTFWTSVVNTFWYVIITVPLQLLVGLVLAIMIQRVTRLRWLYRMVYFIPYITSTVAVSWVWRLIYSKDTGLLNAFLGWLHVPPQPWLTSPSQAMISVAIVMIWQNAGFSMLIFMAGLEAVPRQFYEAAKIDGAGSWNLFRRITWPLLNPTIVFLAVTGVISSLQTFTQIENLTGGSGGYAGGPLNSTISMVVYMYNSAFSDFNLQYGSAISVFLFVLILVVTLVQLRLFSRSYEY